MTLLIPLASAVGNALPMTANDIGLMLRSGYSSKSVERELAQRHFIGALDLKQEDALIKSGASNELITQINGGVFSLSAADSAKAEKEISELKQRRASATETSKKADARYQQQVTKDRATATAASQGAAATSDFLRGTLVRYDRGLVPVADDALSQKKFILFYFSAHWCGPCRQFTPKLIDYYKKVVAAHPEVELVFYSFDRTPGDMENYMRETGMPWLAIDYAKREEKPNLPQVAGPSIPGLYLVERTGRLLSNAYTNDKYVGPEKVLSDLDAILAGQGPQVAQAR